MRRRMLLLESLTRFEYAAKNTFPFESILLVKDPKSIDQRFQVFDVGDGMENLGFQFGW